MVYCCQNMKNSNETNMERILLNKSKYKSISRSINKISQVTDAFGISKISPGYSSVPVPIPPKNSEAKQIS